jgi:phage shock protein A
MAAFARADGPAQDRKAQRARLLTARDELGSKVEVARRTVAEIERKYEWTRATKGEAEAILEMAKVKDGQKADAAARAVVSQYADLLAALQRRQADLYADMIAAGETP